MVLEKDESYTPPDNKPDLHRPRYWKARYFEGGTIEEALPHLEIALMEGCTAHWNGRQYTVADIELNKGLLELEDKLKDLKEGAPVLKEALQA